MEKKWLELKDLWTQESLWRMIANSGAVWDFESVRTEIG